MFQILGALSMAIMTHGIRSETVGCHSITIKKIPATIKFTNLQTACIGKAASTLGEWDLTDDDYAKAWNRLQSIFEDDYMQLQSFMQKFFNLPHMRASSSQSIRNVIDTVQKHIHGIKRFVKADDTHPYVVFAVIDRMDTETYLSLIHI